MARSILTFDPPVMLPGATPPTCLIHEDVEYKTNDGPKLGSALIVGDVFVPRPGTVLVIASITPEA